jgi:hypothetical protein
MIQHIKTIDELASFYDTYKCWPTRKGNRTEKENSLAEYILSRRKNKREGKLSLELENIIKEKVPELNLD